NIPLTPSGTPGTASYQTGFTSVNMEPKASGGVPPWGPDFNGLFQAQTTAQIWQQSGYTWTFDSAFASNANIGGYPAGSVLMMGSGKGLWVNQTDNNTASPDATGSSGWVGLPAAGTYAITTTGGTTTPDSSTLGVTTLLISGTLTSNATLVLPLIAGSRWIVANNTTGSFTLTVQGATGAGVAITQGSALTVFTDGTAYFAASANLSGAYLPIGGTAVAATKLATARTFSLSGQATGAGTTSFDGTGNLVINVTALAPTAAQINAGLTYTAANDANVVHINGTETIVGVKTFSSNIIASASVTTPLVVIGTAGGLFYETSPGNGSVGVRSGVAGSPNYYTFAADGSFNVQGGAITATGNIASSAAVSGATITSSGVVNSGANFTSTSSTVNLHTTGAGTVQLRPNGQGSSTGQLSIASTGNVVASGTITPGSDERIKDNVQPITGALDMVRAALVGVEYDRNDQDGAHDAGFIAQRVKQHLPHLVPITKTHGFDDFHSMNYNGAVAYLSAALVELHDIVKKQQTVIDALTAKVG